MKLDIRGFKPVGNLDSVYKGEQRKIKGKYKVPLISLYQYTEPTKGDVRECIIYAAGESISGNSVEGELSGLLNYPKPVLEDMSKGKFPEALDGVVEGVSGTPKRFSVVWYDLAPKKLVPNRAFYLESNLPDEVPGSDQVLLKWEHRGKSRVVLHAEAGLRTGALVNDLVNELYPAIEGVSLRDRSRELTIYSACLTADKWAELWEDGVFLDFVDSGNLSEELETPPRARKQ